MRALITLVLVTLPRYSFMKRLRYVVIVLITLLLILTIRERFPADRKCYSKTFTLSNGTIYRIGITLGFSQARFEEMQKFLDESKPPESMEIPEGKDSWITERHHAIKQYFILSKEIQARKKKKYCWYVSDMTLTRNGMPLIIDAEVKWEIWNELERNNPLTRETLYEEQDETVIDDSVGMYCDGEYEMVYIKPLLFMIKGDQIEGSIGGSGLFDNVKILREKMAERPLE